MEMTVQVQLIQITTVIVSSFYHTSFLHIQTTPKERLKWKITPERENGGKVPFSSSFPSSSLSLSPRKSSVKGFPSESEEESLPSSIDLFSASSTSESWRRSRSRGGFSFRFLIGGGRGFGAFVPPLFFFFIEAVAISVYFGVERKRGFFLSCWERVGFKRLVVGFSFHRNPRHTCRRDWQVDLRAVRMGWVGLDLEVKLGLGQT